MTAVSKTPSKTTKASAKPKEKTAAKPKVKAAATKKSAAAKQPKAPVKPVPRVKAKLKQQPKPTPKAKTKSKKKFVDEYMTEEHRDFFRQMLLKAKRQLMEEVDRTVKNMQDQATNDPDPADRATQEEEFSIELRTRDRERRLIKKIDSTLDLIDQDEYGFCDSCGIEIGLQRLEARPTATQCIDCKMLSEIKEKQILG